MHKTSNNKLLGEVVDIRLMLVVLLVLYHAFAPFSGSWKPIDGIEEIKAYWWFDKLSYALLLESFVFISGYVFGYQVRRKGEEMLKCENLIWKKFKRLMIPSIFFSILYIVLFKDITQPITTTIYGVINGVWHMWFLPMLFWCFIFTGFIERTRISSIVLIPVLLLLAVIVPETLPLRMGKSFYYLPFFYVGYLLQRKNLVEQINNKTTPRLVLALLFIATFPTLTLLCENIGIIWSGGGKFYNFIIENSVEHICKLIYSSIGLSLLFLTIRKKEKERDGNINPLTVEMGNLCMGVYLLQQFILIFLYYYTMLPDVVGSYVLPWVGFIITLILSTILTFIMRKTNVERLILG